MTNMFIKPNSHNTQVGLDAVLCYDQEIKITNVERHKAANLVAHA